MASLELMKLIVFLNHAQIVCSVESMIRVRQVAGSNRNERPVYKHDL